jgi:hypothetical protein
MLSSAKNSKHNGSLKKDAVGPNPQSVKLSRQDFHYFATSLLNPNPNSIFHLEELVKEDINSCFENGKRSEDFRQEMIQEKYDIDPKDYIKASETAFLDTIEYFVNGFVPMLTASMNESNSNLQNPKDSKNPSNDLKKLFTNLMEFHKESTTEIKILNNLYPTKKKLVIDTDIVENIAVQPKRSRKQATTPSTDISVSNFDSYKKPCPYDNCGKMYTTNGALSYHIRTKHRRCDTLEKYRAESFLTKREFPSRNLINKIKPSSSFCLTPQPTKLPQIEFPQTAIFNPIQKKIAAQHPKTPIITAEAPMPEILGQGSQANLNLTAVVVGKNTVESDSESIKRSTIGSTTAPTREVSGVENYPEDDIIIKKAFCSESNNFFRLIGLGHDNNYNGYRSGIIHGGGEEMYAGYVDEDEIQLNQMFQFFNRDTDGQIKRDSIFIGLEEFDEGTTVGFPPVDASDNASFILFDNNHPELGKLFCG